LTAARIVPSQQLTAEILSAFRALEGDVAIVPPSRDNGLRCSIEIAFEPGRDWWRTIESANEIAFGCNLDRIRWLLVHFL
jgi:hypothetical protein